MSVNRDSSKFALSHFEKALSYPSNVTGLVVCVFLYFALPAALVFGGFSFQQLLPSSIDYPWGSSKDLISEIRETNSIFLMVQATLIGVILPLAIALVSLILQQRGHSSSNAKIGIYYRESGAFKLAWSSFALIIVLIVHQIFAIICNLNPNFLTVNILAAQAAWLGIHGLWLLRNSLAIVQFLRFSLRFVDATEQQNVLQRFCFLESARRNIEHQLTRNYWSDLNKSLSCRSNNATSVKCKTILVPGADPEYILYDARPWVVGRVVLIRHRRAKRSATRSKNNCSKKIGELSFDLAVGNRSSESAGLDMSHLDSGFNACERFLLNRSFIFREIRKLEKLAGPKPDDILKQLASEALECMSHNEFVEFSDSLDRMVHFHSFLIRSYTMVSERRVSDGVTVCCEDLLSEVNDDWLLQYRSILTSAGDLLTQEPRYFEKAIDISSDLVAQTGIDSSRKVIGSLFQPAKWLFHRGVNWRTRLMAANLAGPPGLPAHRAWLGNDGSEYRHNLRCFVGRWEQFQYTPNRIWKRESVSCCDKAKRWEPLRASIGFVREHLACTAYMVAAAGCRRDTDSIAWMSDVLIRWRHLFTVESDQDVPLEIAVLNPAVSVLRWDDQRLQSELKVLAPDDVLEPEFLFNAIVDVLWTDMLVTLSAIMAGWGYEWNAVGLPKLAVANELPVGSMLIPSFGVGPMKRKPFQSVTHVLRAMIRQYGDLETFGDARYEGWLDRWVSRLDETAVPDAVEGRPRGLSTMGKTNIYRLGPSHLEVLMLLANIDSPAELSGDLRQSIEIGAKQFIKGKLKQSPASTLKWFGAHLSEMSGDNWFQGVDYETFRKVHQEELEIRKRWVGDLLRDAIEVAESVVPPEGRRFASDGRD